MSATSFIGCPKATCARPPTALAALATLRGNPARHDSLLRSMVGPPDAFTYPPLLLRARALPVIIHAADTFTGSICRGPDRSSSCHTQRDGARPPRAFRSQDRRAPPDISQSRREVACSARFSQQAGAVCSCVVIALPVSGTAKRMIDSRC